MRFQLPEHIFEYSLADVVSVFYNRYPNSFAKHNISEDVLWREVTDDRIVTKKLIVKKGSGFINKLPKWISGQTNIQFMPTLEESIFCRRTHKLVSYTRNIAGKHLVNMSERCTYRELPSAHTAVERQLEVVANCRFHSLVDKVLMLAFRKTMVNTVRGYNEKLVERFGPPLKTATDNRWKSSEQVRMEKNTA
ncbi:hypothetical protein GPALN_006129 [Globodera pallida]|uniref:PRELI/MSF1 domain-containing protein n=1 Tax=Globodera pallida TaxID=36090 RepID=A0A183BQ20_GLOPA|nr:hypothetical protein GPALN_006129 [Globodera pallida]